MPKGNEKKRNIFDITGDRPATKIQQALYIEMDNRSGKGGLWQNDEISALLNAVNEERKRIGKGPIDRGKIEKTQQSAFGYIDYVVKIAFECEKLVYE